MQGYVGLLIGDPSAGHRRSLYEMGREGSNATLFSQLQKPKDDIIFPLV